MKCSIPELRQRRLTDQRLSFGAYLIIMVALIALMVVIAVTMVISLVARIPEFFPYREFPFGFQSSSYPWSFFALAGWVIGLIVVAVALSIIYWWYQWQLYKRRNEHIERAKRLKLRLSRWLKEKYKIDVEDLTWSDTHLSIREQHRGTGFFVLWVVFNYLSWTIPLVGFILTLVAWYWLTVDYYFHEQGEQEFFRRVSHKLEEKGVSFDPAILYPLYSRNMVLYIVLTFIVPGWTIWWSYVLFHDGNVHFDTHEHWESQLERIINQVQTSVPPELPLEILKERYVRGEISKEDFERMKGELSEE